MRKVLILGSTGSIGRQALEIVAGSRELSVVGLAAGGRWEDAVSQARAAETSRLALASAEAAAQRPTSSARSTVRPPR